MTNMQLSPDMAENLPNRRMETWRWSDVRAKVKPDAPGLSDAGTPDFTLPDGVKLSKTPLMGRDTQMSQLAAVYAGAATLIEVKTTPNTSLEISNLETGHSQIVVWIGAGACLDVIETYTSGEPAFINTQISYELAKGAKLRRTIVQNDHEDTTRISTAVIRMDPGAALFQHTLAFGARLTRLETQIKGVGANVTATLKGAYLLSGQRHCDMTSHIDLEETGAVIDQAVKGVVSDEATGVFQGKFHVYKNAQHTDAKMRHDALMLSETSHIKAKPELEIYADDVACAHGNTIGALDETALFYMRQRGIPLKSARRILTEAFVAQAFDDLNPLARDIILAPIRTWLEAN